MTVVEATPFWVTGAEGFVGHNMVEHLLSFGHRVIGFGRGSSNQNKSKSYTYLSGSMSSEVLKAAIEDYGVPQAIYHFAGGSSVGRSIIEPLSDFESNVVASARLFDTVRCLCPFTPITIASSAAVYGNKTCDPISVKLVTNPFSPYGHHKLMLEQLAKSYVEAYQMRINVLRIFSVYGSGLEKQLLFDLCTRLTKNEPSIVLGGTGEELRDWCHVNDVVRFAAFLPLANQGEFNLYNLGSGNAVSVSKISQKLITIWGGGSKLTFSGNSRPGDPFSLVALPNEIPKEFEFQVDLDKGLAEMVAWFKSRAAGN
jgi:UDP-glucose 4-epimerase